MFNVTVTGANPKELAANLTKARAMLMADGEDTDAIDMSELRGKGKKAAKKTEEDETEEFDLGGSDDTEEQDETEEEEAPKKTKGKKEITRDDVRVALGEYAEEHGREKAVKLLKKHGDVTMVNKLDPENFAKVMKAISA